MDRDLLKIDGKEIEIELKYYKKEFFIKRFGILKEHSKQLAEKGITYNWNMFFFWTTWECLIKRGIWPFKKPFRSLAHMIKSINDNEYEEVINYTTNKILGVKKTEGKETKNPQTENLKVS